MSALNFSKKFLCAGCGDNIYDSSLLRVICAECVPVVDLCLECFAAKVEIGQHRSTHAYRLADNGDLVCPLSEEWSARELVQLLEGLEQFGHGNWNDVARYVDSKEPSECKEAVNALFVEGPIGAATFKESERGLAVDHTQPLQSQYKQSNKSPADSEADSQLGIHELILLGYMPSRGDFEVEHENGMEDLVAGLQDIPAVQLPGEDYDEVDQGLQIAQVDIYQRSLKEREKRKKVMKDFGLVEAFFKENPINPTTGKLSAPKPKKKDPMSEALEKIKPLSQYQNVEDYKKLVNSITREKELKQRIKELLRYRKNGISGLHETEAYEAQRLKRNKRKAERKKALESGVPMETGVSFSSEDEKPAETDLDKISSIVELPGYDLMSTNEKRLCTSLRLHPNLYLSYKTCLLRDHLSKKKGQIPKPVHPSGLDKVHRKKIFNFLLHSGWISAY